MIAVDTNVLARFILADDRTQAETAAVILAAAAWVSATVWVELGWVLGTRLGLDRPLVADALDTLLNLRTLHTADPEGMLWAVERYRSGADWADMVHLVSTRNDAERFATFDRRLARQAGTPTPLPIETF